MDVLPLTELLTQLWAGAAGGAGVEAAGLTGSDDGTIEEAARLKPEASMQEFGGRQEARTPDLRVANAALSQLS